MVAVYRSILFGRRLATSIRGGASVSEAHGASSTHAYIHIACTTTVTHYGGSLYLNVSGPDVVRRVLGFFRIISYKRYPTTSSLRRHSLCHSETEYCAHQRKSAFRHLAWSPPAIHASTRRRRKCGRRHLAGCKAPGQLKCDFQGASDPTSRAHAHLRMCHVAGGGESGHASAGTWRSATPQAGVLNWSSGGDSCDGGA